MRTPTEIRRRRGGAGLDGPRRDDGGSARLTRFATWVLGVEAMLLVALGVSGLGGRATPPDGLPTAAAPLPVPELLGFRPNPAHSVLLLVTGLLALGALWLPAWRRGFAASQAVGYLLVGGAGLVLAAATPAASPWHLNPADHVLHGLLCLLGLALLALGRPTHQARHGTGPTAPPAASHPNHPPR